MVRSGLSLVIFLLSVTASFAQIIVFPTPPPVINTQPASPTSVCRGTTIVHQVGASGSSLFYQWYITGPPGCEFCSTALTNSGAYSGVNTPNLNVASGLLAIGTYYYFCEVSNLGGAVSSSTVQMNVVSAPTNTPSAFGASSCAPSALTLSASGASAGAGQSYRWFTGATGPAIGGQTASTYTTPVLSSTTTYYVAIANINGCTGPRAAVTAAINTPNTPTTTAGNRCGPGTVVVSASGGTAGQYRWYTGPTSGVIPGQTNATYTTPSLAGSTTYYVAINNGPCESPRIAVLAEIRTIPPVPTTTGASRCGTGTLVLSASGGTAGQYRWYTDPTAGPSIAGQTSNTYTTPSISAPTTYYVSLNNGNCESARAAVVAQVNTVPGNPVTTGANRCGPGSVLLSATGGAAGQYRWYTATTGPAIAGQTNATYTTPSLSAPTTYYVSIDNGNCETPRVAVVAQINTIPSAPTTTGANRCGAGSLVLTASGGSAGQYRWYTDPSAGPSIAGQTSATYTTPSLNATTTYYVSVDNGTCETARVSVVAQVNTVPGNPVTTGANRCGPGSLLLSATGGAAGQYRWYTATTGPAIGGQTNATYTTPSLNGPTTYYVSIDNGNCETPRVAVVAQINTIPSAPTTTGANRCGAGSLVLTASGGSAGQYRWYTATTGPAIAGQTSATYTTPMLNATTTYYVSVDNGTCETARVSVVAQINTGPAAPVTTGANRCGPGSVLLSATGGVAGQYRWYTATTGPAIGGQTNAAYTTPSLSAPTTYYVSIDNGNCETPRVAVVAQINPIPSAPTTTGANRCGAGSLVLTASGGAGQYRWYTATTGPAIAGQTSATYTTPSLNATTNYYVSINNGSCESARVEVTATINAVPQAPTTAGGSSCSGSITLTASGGATGQYRWYAESSGGNAIAGATSATYNATVVSTTTLFVSIDNGVCESARTAVTATVLPECNQPPVIGSADGVTKIGGEVTIDIKSLISDPNNNIDFSSLTIIQQPESGARAEIINGSLLVNYKGITFSGQDKLIVGVCDLAKACSQQDVFIEVGGSVKVYNAVSPNGDGKNDLLIMENIEVFEDTRENVVSVFNRWGDEVWSTTNYDNDTCVFDGKSSAGKELSAGVYYYKIKYKGNKDAVTGYFELRR